MDRKERGEQLQEQVEEAVADLEAQLALGFTEDFLRTLEFYSHFHHYSIMNSFLIQLQRPGAKLCAGYKQWDKLGYHVRQGEQAIWVRAPWMKKIADPDTGEIQEQLIGWLAVPLFDVSQLVEEVELHSITKPIDDPEFEWHYLLALTALGAAEGVVVIEDTLPQGIHGMSTGGKVFIEQSLSVGEKFLTLLHELSHEVLHHGEDRDETTREQRELEAESCSFVLARVYGLDNPWSRNYILSFKGTVEDLHDSLSHIHQAVKKIVGMIGIDPAERQMEALAVKEAA